MHRVKIQRTASTTLRPAPPIDRLANRMSLPEPGLDHSNEKKIGGLVLTRHLGESIMIGDRIEVEVVGLKSGTVRLKIVAPRTIAVHRREIYDEIQANPDVTRFAKAVAPETSPDPDRPLKARGGLVLTRNALESIMIGDEIELAVVDVRPSTVKLKIVAPRTVSVHRREVYEAIQGDDA